MADPLTHAGAVAFRENEGEVRFLVVSSSNGRNYVLPKGHIEPGEAPEATARRELEEEAGVRGEVLAPLTVQKYDKSGEPVRVQYFLVRAAATVASEEARELIWATFDEALARLSFPDAREALRLGAAAVERGTS